MTEWPKIVAQYGLSANLSKDGPSSDFRVKCYYGIKSESDFASSAETSYGRLMRLRKEKEKRGYHLNVYGFLDTSSDTLNTTKLAKNFEVKYPSRIPSDGESVSNLIFFPSLKGYSPAPDSRVILFANHPVYTCIQSTRIYDAFFDEHGKVKNDTGCEKRLIDVRSIEGGIINMATHYGIPYDVLHLFCKKPNYPKFRLSDVKTRGVLLMNSTHGLLPNSWQDYTSSIEPTATGYHVKLKNGLEIDVDENGSACGGWLRLVTVENVELYLSVLSVLSCTESDESDVAANKTVVLNSEETPKSPLNIYRPLEKRDPFEDHQVTISTFDK